MLLRELVRRHVPAGQKVAVAADPELFSDLDRACEWAPAAEWPVGPDPDVVLVDATTVGPLAESLARWPSTRTWVLVHTAAPQDLPVGPLVAAARSHGLNLVEAVALPGHHKVGLVASRNPDALLGYLNEQEIGAPDAARLAWEWALSTLGARSRDAAAADAIARLTAERDGLRAELDSVTAQAARDAKAHAEAHSKELEKVRAEADKLRASASYALGQHLVGIKRHPLRTVRKLRAENKRLKRR
jgi:hypothetical protein